VRRQPLEAGSYDASNFGHAMKNSITVLIFLMLGWYGYSEYQLRAHPSSAAARKPAGLLDASQGQFACDGRTRCSQMTSCAEATFFLQSCPNTQMDGDDDGVPCERQWCR
jgi:hypothetical protein